VVAARHVIDGEALGAQRLGQACGQGGVVFDE